MRCGLVRDGERGNWRKRSGSGSGSGSGGRRSGYAERRGYCGMQWPPIMGKGKQVDETGHVWNERRGLRMGVSETSLPNASWWFGRTNRTRWDNPPASILFVSRRGRRDKTERRRGAHDDSLGNTGLRWKGAEGTNGWPVIRGRLVSRSRWVLRVLPATTDCVSCLGPRNKLQYKLEPRIHQGGIS